MPEITLQCCCGKVQGKTANLSPSTGTRLVCCCRDCQSFAAYIDQEKAVLDQYGGTDILQMPVSQLKILQGIEQIACVRLSEKGMYRWYTKCCNTPIGNTMGAGGAFVGVVHNFMDNQATRDDDFGKSRGHIQTTFARQKIPLDLRGPIFKIIASSLFKIILWKLKGYNKPSVFFGDTGKPISEPKILSQED